MMLRDRREARLIAGLVCAILLAAGAIAFTVTSSIRRSIERDLLSWRAERYARECDNFVRSTLISTRSMLWAPTTREREMGGVMYARHLWVNDGHEMNVCAPPGLYVGEWCADDDRACMIHALDWALAWTR